jgi:RecB family exonuclease
VSDKAIIERLSPSTLGALRRCGLSVYLRRSSGAGSGAGPSSPPARLGTAAHEVLEWVANHAPELWTAQDREEQVRSRWTEATKAQESLARRHKQEDGFGPREQWPNFSTIQERVVVEAERLALELHDLPPSRRQAERELRDSDTPLFGTVDLIIVDDADDATVIDHKTAAVSEDDIAEGGKYHAQVLIYAALARDAGLHPTVAEVRPIGRRPISMVVDDTTIDKAIGAALDDLEHYNSMIAAGEALDLARPSADACRWCEFACECPAIWGTTAPLLEGFQAIEGTVTRVERSNRGSIGLQVDSAAGSMRGPVVVAGLTRHRFPLIDTIKEGQIVRISGLVEAAPNSTTLIAKNMGWVRVEVGAKADRSVI